MKFKTKLKNLKVVEKLRVYRISMIMLIVVMGIVSIFLSFLMNTKVNEITDVWSPSLEHVQELDMLTSEYRMKQYGHLVAMDEETVSKYEDELEKIDQNITEINNKFEAMISTEIEKSKYDNIYTKWASYKEQSKEILALSREGKTKEAGLLMVGEVYDTYNDFCKSFEELKTYENTQLAEAKKVVETLFISMLVIIIAIVVASIGIATSIGIAIGKMITKPVAQIQEAIVSMREGELGTVEKKLREALVILTNYVTEISDELRRIARGDLTRDGNEITNFLGEFSSIKESLLYILKRFNSTLTEIQDTSTHVASDAEEIAKASQMLSEGASEQASTVEELTATVNTISTLAVESAKATQHAYEQVKDSTDKAEIEKQKMQELAAEMKYITEISKEIGNIITAIEDIASQTNLLSLNASIEAARAGEAGRGFAVVADQIGKLASDSAQSAVNTRELINKTLVEIEKGNTITISTAESFDQIITNMKLFADLAQQSTENANEQASALKQIEEGIEQIAGATQNTATSSEENSAISVNLSDKSIKLDELVKRFKLF